MDTPLVNGAEGIHGPLSLPAESGLEGEFSGFGGGVPPDKSGGVLTILGGLCAGAGTGKLQIISAAIKPVSA